MADVDDSAEPTEIDLTPPPAPRSANRKAALVLGALAVAAGGVFAALSLGGSSNGPEDPVRAMFESAERGDVLGVLEQLDPGERDALREPLTDLVAELNRLDVLHDADLGHVSGVDLKVDDLELRSTNVRDDLARVSISGGKGSYSFDASKLPLGGFVRDLAGDSLDATSSGSDDLTSSSADDFVATVRHGDRWYVSIGYTVAEGARRSAGASIDSLGAGVAAKGADSPEAAVRELVAAGTKLDLRRVIELLPPDELAAVHDYAGMFIDDVEQAAADARERVQIEVPTLELDSETDGDHGLVYVRDLSFSGSADGESMTYEDGCLDISGTEPQHVCTGDDPTELFRTFAMRSDLEPPKLSFEGKHAKVGIVVTRVDGKWYVSPTRTMLEGLVGELKLFQPRDLTTIRDYLQQAIEDASSFTTDTEYFTGFPTTTIPAN